MGLFSIKQFATQTETLCIWGFFSSCFVWAFLVSNVPCLKTHLMFPVCNWKQYRAGRSLPLAILLWGLFFPMQAAAQFHQSFRQGFHQARFLIYLSLSDKA